MKLQQCISMVQRVALKVPSERDPTVVYVVDATIRSGFVNCSCPGFQHRGRCKHVDVQHVSCGWSERDGEHQTPEQARSMTCPRCGQTTVGVDIYAVASAKSTGYGRGWV